MGPVQSAVTGCCQSRRKMTKEDVKEDSLPEVPTSGAQTFKLIATTGGQVRSPEPDRRSPLCAIAIGRSSPACDAVSLRSHRVVYCTGAHSARMLHVRGQVLVRTHDDKDWMVFEPTDGITEAGLPLSLRASNYAAGCTAPLSQTHTHARARAQLPSIPSHLLPHPPLAHPTPATFSAEAPRLDAQLWRAWCRLATGVCPVGLEGESEAARAHDQAGAQAAGRPLSAGFEIEQSEREVVCGSLGACAVCCAWEHVFE